MAEALLAGGERFIGRAQELQRVDALLDAARRNDGQLVVVSGEAGIGKSRFCNAVLERAEATGFVTAMGRGWVDRGAPGLWPWQAVLTRLCGADASALLDDRPGPSTVEPDRFARFVAVVDRLEHLSVSAPIVMVIDDLHATDAGAVLLARFVARSLHRLRLLLVVTRRTGEPPADPEVERLLDELEQEATRLTLGHLDLRESTALLEADRGAPVDAELALASLRVTGGNPLYLKNLLALGPVGGQHLVGGLRRAIDGLVGHLDPAVGATLAAAAVLGPDPTVTETAAAADRAPAAVLEAMGQGVTAGLLTVTGPHRYAFVHDLVREALEAGLPADQRLAVHARIVAFIGAATAGTAPDGLARRAHHALAAAPRSPADAQLAVEACCSAAEMMVRRFSYERAADLLAAAVDLHDRGPLGAPPTALLFDRARALLQAGRLAESRQAFDRVATAALDAGDPVLLAEAALGLGGVWLHEHRDETEHRRVLEIQHRALAGLPPAAMVLTRRLQMRLAAEAAYDGGPVAEAWAALAAVRAVDDGPALAEALSLCHHALLSSAHVSARLALADELVTVAAASGEGMLSLFGLCWRAVDLFQLGDPRAPRALTDLRTRADAVGCRSISYVVDVIDVMLLIRAGRLDEAEAAALRGHETGAAVGDADALGYLGAHLFTIRWLQGRAAEVVDPLEEVAASPTVTAEAAFSFWAGVASMAADAGQRERAAAALASVTDGGLERAPRTSTWLTGMRLVVEAARVLGDAPVAEDAYRLLLPYADLPVMSSLAVVDHGSVEGALGSAALAFGRPDVAVDHLERAVATNRRLGNRAFAVVAQADLAQALRRRDEPGDAAAARTLFAQAATEAGAMGIRLRDADDWGDDHRSEGTVAKAGRHWTIDVGDRRAVVVDMVGMDYLARLLTQPGVELPVLALAGGGVGVGDGSTAQPVLDERARQAYALRVRELDASLDQAALDVDLARVERLTVEREALFVELRRAAGFEGRPATFAGPHERARTAVRKAIKRAIDEIAAADAEIGGILRATVRTGSTCCYEPDVATPIAWQLVS